MSASRWKRLVWLLLLVLLAAPMFLLRPSLGLAQGEIATPQPVRRPNIFIRSSWTEPGSVTPGSEVTVYVELHNVGDAGAQEIMVSFGGSGWAPVGSSTVKNVPSLQRDEHGTLWQPMRLAPDIGGNSLPISVQITYKDGQGFGYSSSEVVGVNLIQVTPTVAPQSGRPQVVIESFATHPALPIPGEPFTLTLTLHNTGTGAARNILLTNGVPSTYAPIGSGNILSVGHIGWQETVAFAYRLVADQDTKPGMHTHQISLDYDNWGGEHYQSAQNVAIEVGEKEGGQAAGGQPLVVLEAYRLEPETLSPGQPFTLTLSVQNVGGASARQVTLTLGGQANASQSSAIAPLGTGNVKYIPGLEPGVINEITTRFIVDGAANGGVYIMTVGFEYLDTEENRLTRSEQISLVVLARPQLEGSFYRPMDAVFVGQPFDLPIEIFNIGRTRLNSSNVEIVSQDLEILGESVYVGPVDAGTSVVLEGQQAISSAPGSRQLFVHLHYIDDFNQAQVYELPMTVEVDALPEPIRLPEGVGRPGEPGGQPAPASDMPQRPFMVRLIRGLLGLGSG